MGISGTSNPDATIDTATLGRTGLTVSRVALGGYDALDEKAFRRAVDLGVSFLISFPGYEREQRAIGQTGRGVGRESVVLATGSAGRSARSVRRDLDRSLQTLRTDYVDLFYLYHVTCDAWPRILAPGGALEQLARARRSGRVRFTGATVHNRDLALRMIESGAIDVLNLRYSLAHPGHEAHVLPAAAKHGCGVVVYSALKYGLLTRRPEGWPARKRVPTPQECYRFVLGNPSVHAVWAGARNVEQVEAITAAARGFVPLPKRLEQSLRRFGEFVHDRYPGNPGPAMRPRRRR
jgi:aryl-alcohol dehydrogenase-like predicted oxidoreductase